MINYLIFAALLARGSAPTHLHFALYGDDRDGHDIHRTIVKEIIAEHPDFVLNTGDLVKRGNRPDLWKIFDEITAPLRATTPYYPAPGNHDYETPDFASRFKLPIPAGDTREYYTFDKGECHFIALAVDEHTEYAPDSPQYKWLAADLESTQGKYAHTFVFYHVPPYSIGQHGSNLDGRAALCPLFEKYHVDMVLNGHDHIYYRTIRNGVTYMVSGGGGAPLYKVDPSKGALPEDKYESVNNYVMIDVDGSKIHFRAVRMDGTVIEEGDVPSVKLASATTKI